MPSRNPADQEAACTLESALQKAVQQWEQSPVELQWFRLLPKRICQSGRLLEVAVAESLVLLDYVRADWNRALLAEQECEKWLECAKAAPRDIECLHAPDPRVWNGLRRRKNCCRAFESIGHAYITCQQVLPHSVVTPTCYDPHNRHNGTREFTPNL
ncbi:hypothetical protein RhiJN_18640 [Ceratobasidium sp. AG-Ba]|nr:hypothetical protein RhiJN_18640 [Ceratobasidium sp. AG-Ba]